MAEVEFQNPKEVTVGEEKFVIYLTEEEIQRRVIELAKKISEDYKDKFPVFIGILNGSFIFMSDLIKQIDINCEVDFLRLSSYGDAKISSGKVRMVKDLNCDVNGRDIIIVEDIVDTGLSLQYMRRLMENYKPASVKIISLLVKPKSLKYDAKIDYIGFEIPSKFVIGYGLDYAQKYRNLRAIYILSENGVRLK
jgi:hypoxanthine phosphoribosyltransferase